MRNYLPKKHFAEAAFQLYAMNAMVSAKVDFTIIYTTDYVTSNAD